MRATSSRRRKRQAVSRPRPRPPWRRASPSCWRSAMSASAMARSPPAPTSCSPLLARRAQLHVLLPFRLDDFIRESVRPAGEQWITRFEACLANAKSVRYATEDEYLGDDTLYVYCSRLGMGLSVLASQHLFAPIEQTVVWDGRPAAGNAGTAVDVDIWRETGRPQTIIPIAPEQRSQRPESPSRSASNSRRSARAMLFGDLRGFSRL